MKLGIIGLGRMGAAITRRVREAGHDVVAYDPSGDARSHVQAMGAEIALSAHDLAAEVDYIWLMVPAGKIVDDVIAEIRENLKPGNIVIDGGNSNFNDSIRRAQALAKDNIHFVDCGTSGGLKGEDIGFSLMIGGDLEAYETLVPIFEAIATTDGYGHMGPAGAGHYVKMVHNGVEYALLQAYGEGFDVLRNGHYKELDLELVSRVWSNGSVIRSWIAELCHEVFSKDQQLRDVSGVIGGGATGTWTSEEAKKQGVPVKLIDESLAIRTWSQESGGNFGTKVVAMLRNKFGGHKLGG